MDSINYIANDAGVYQVFNSIHHPDGEVFDFVDGLYSRDFIIDNKAAFVVLCTYIWRKHVRNSS